MRTTKKGKFFLYLILTLGALLILFPMYITITTTFKTPAESAVSFFTLPKSLYLGNYATVLQDEKLYYAYGNTILITVVSLLGEMLILPPMGFALSRGMKQNRFFKGLYFFFLLNGERHENHVLQSELAQLDHHLEMEFTSTKDFLAGNLSSPDYHDSMIWEAEQLRTIASCGYYFQSSGFGADDAWLEVFSELSQFVQSPESFQQLTPQERETLAAFLNDYSYQNDPVLGPGDTAEVLDCLAGALERQD